MATALASPSRIAPSSQIMDTSPPNSTTSAAIAVDDRPSSRFSRSSSLSQSGDFPSSNSLRSEEYRQLFRLPSDEVLVQDFNCAFQENILLQGHMYLFEHYICFYSNIFGFETKKIIPFQEVTCVRRAKTAGIFPNAIEIVAAGKKHFFASFLSRDEAFKLIADGWSQSGTGSKEFLDGQDAKSETSSQLNGVSSLENGNSSDSPVSDCDSDERNLEVSRSGGINPSPNQDDDDARPCSTEVPVSDAPLVPEPSSSSRSGKWEESGDAPELPRNYTKVGESKFPISVERFFNLFFSDDGRSFVESYHKACGDRDVTFTSWTPHDKFGYVREKSFQHPIKIYFGAKCSGCKETQKYQVYKNSHLVIETSQEVSDVPYADYFTVQIIDAVGGMSSTMLNDTIIGIWDVQKDGDELECCVLRVYVTVSFCKRTMWKGKIEQSTIEEYKDAYANWVQLAHELLKQKNIEKIEGIDATGNMVRSDQITALNAGRNGEYAERLHVNSESGRNTDSVANTSGSHEQTENLLQENLLQASAVMSTIRAFLSKVGSFLKSQGNRQQFLIIAFSIILLLMQLSIVVLLSRPQQVYVIPQADHISSVGHGSGQRAAEAVAWMEKRVYLLKDEMLVVEAQLERMRHEHILLKAQLKDLEHLSKQHR